MNLLCLSCVPSSSSILISLRCFLLYLHVAANPLSPFLSFQSSFSSVFLYFLFCVTGILSCSHPGFSSYRYVQSPFCGLSDIDSYVLSIGCNLVAGLCWRLYTYTCSAWMCVVTSSATYSGGEVRTKTPYTSIELLEAWLLYISEIDKAMTTTVKKSCESIN